MPSTQKLRQSVLVQAPPRDVYDALLDATTLSRIFGRPVQASAAKGGRFSLFGRIHGSNLELARGKRIVQSFRHATPGWPMEHLSKVTIQLRAVPDGTRVILDHSAIPHGCAEAVAEHWRDHVWPGIRSALEGRAKPLPRAVAQSRRKVVH